MSGTVKSFVRINSFHPHNSRVNSIIFFFFFTSEETERASDFLKSQRWQQRGHSSNPRGLAPGPVSLPLCPSTSLSCRVVGRAHAVGSERIQIPFNSKSQATDLTSLSLSFLMHKVRPIGL